MKRLIFSFWVSAKFEIVGWFYSVKMYVGCFFGQSISVTENRYATKIEQLWQVRGVKFLNFVYGSFMCWRRTAEIEPDSSLLAV